MISVLCVRVNKTNRNRVCICRAWNSCVLCSKDAQTSSGVFLPLSFQNLKSCAQHASFLSFIRVYAIFVSVHVFTFAAITLRLNTAPFLPPTIFFFTALISTFCLTSDMPYKINCSSSSYNFSLIVINTVVIS